MKLAAGMLLLMFAASDLRPVLSSPENAAESFRQGYLQFSSRNFPQAKELFEKSLTSAYLLSDYSLYYLALIAFQGSDWEVSRQRLSQLRQQYPQSIWFQPAELLRARIFLAERKYPECLELLRSLRTDKMLRREISEEATYLQAHALAAQNEVHQAYALYIEVRNLAPQSQWAAAGRKEMKRLRERHPELFGLSTPTAMLEEADRLTVERQYSDAETLYRKLLEQEPRSPLTLRVLSRLVDLYLSARKRNEAIPLLEEIARDYPDSSEAPAALYRIGQILWNRHDNGQALGYFKQMIDRYPSASDVDKAFFAAADIYESQGKKDEAIAFYNTLPKRFPHSPVRDDAIWRLGWLYYNGGELRKASSAFKSLADNARQESYRTAAAYWHARAFERLGEAHAARQLYRKILRNGDESYYHALASARLGGVDGSVTQDRRETPSYDLDPTSVGSIDAEFHFARARELAVLSLNPLAISELDEVSRLSGNNPQIVRLLMRDYARTQAYSRSVALANQLPRSWEDRDRYRFPLAYWQTIQEKARTQELDPYLVLALIRQESLFDPAARSPANALGLMQLLPSTAARVAKQIGLPPPANERLFDPEFNVTLGTQYLKTLLDRYSNNLYKAIAAYNAGEPAVDRWQTEILTDDIEEFVERIPYLETRQYVKLVIRNNRIYKRLYDQK